MYILIFAEYLRWDLRTCILLSIYYYCKKGFLKKSYYFVNNEVFTQIQKFRWNYGNNTNLRQITLS